MSIPLTLFHPMDPRGAKVGGAEMFMRSLIRHAPADFAITLAGVSSTGPAGGEWTLTEGRTSYRFLPLLRIADEDRRGRIPLSLRYTLALRPLRRRFDGQVLFFNRIEPIWLFRRHANAKIVAIHNDIPGQIASGRSEVLWSRFPRVYFALERRCLPRADLVWTVSPATARHCRQRHPELDGRLLCSPTWFEPEWFHPADDRADARRQVAALHPELREPGPWILFTGRFQPQKAPLRLLEAFDRLRQTTPAARLLLVGDGNLKADLLRMVQDRKLEGRVAVFDSRPQAELAPFYRAADVFLLASDYEGMPISVLEALACGLPVVSTPVGEVPALVRPGITGELADACTADALAAALERLLARRERCSAAACAASVQPFTPAAVLAPLYDRIRKLAVAGADPLNARQDSIRGRC